MSDHQDYLDKLPEIKAISEDMRELINRIKTLEKQLELLARDANQKDNEMLSLSDKMVPSTYYCFLALHRTRYNLVHGYNDMISIIGGTKVGNERPYFNEPLTPKEDWPKYN